jgi:hypothetical protein
MASPENSKLRLSKLALYLHTLKNISNFQEIQNKIIEVANDVYDKRARTSIQTTLYSRLHKTTKAGKSYSE